MTHRQPTIQLSPIELSKPKRSKRETLGIIALGAATGAGLFLGGTLLGAARVGALALGAVKGLVGTPKKAAITATAIGILQTSPKAREFVKKKLRDPTGAGRELGKIIEDPSKLQPEVGKTTKEKILDVGKKAGLIGAGAVGAAALVAAAKKLSSVRAPTIPTIGAIPSAVLPTAILPAEPSLSTRTQPLGAVEQPKPKDVAPGAVLPDIKINNSPEINIRFSKSKKFINQQVLLKS